MAFQEFTTWKRIFWGGWDEWIVGKWEERLGQHPK